MYTFYLNIWSRIHALLVLSAHKTYKTGCGWNLWMEHMRLWWSWPQVSQFVHPSWLQPTSSTGHQHHNTRDKTVSSKTYTLKRNLEKQMMKWNPELLIFQPFGAHPYLGFQENAQMKSTQCWNNRRNDSNLQAEGRYSQERMVRSSKVPVRPGVYRKPCHGVGCWGFSERRRDIDKGMCDAIFFLATTVSTSLALNTMQSPNNGRKHTKYQAQKKSCLLL